MPSIRAIISNDFYEKLGPEKRTSLKSEWRTALADELNISAALVEVIFFPFADAENTFELTLDVLFSAKHDAVGVFALSEVDNTVAKINSALTRAIEKTSYLPSNITYGIWPQPNYNGVFTEIVKS